MQVSIVSRTSSLFEGTAKSVVIPSVMGQIGILEGHEPILGVLDEGYVQIKDAAGKVTKVGVSRGIYSVDNDKVTIACQSELKD